MCDSTAVNLLVVSLLAGRYHAVLTSDILPHLADGDGAPTVRLTIAAEGI